jgi:hypothetical protein
MYKLVKEQDPKDAFVKILTNRYSGEPKIIKVKKEHKYCIRMVRHTFLTHIFTSRYSIKAFTLTYEFTV